LKYDIIPYLQCNIINITIKYDKCSFGLRPKNCPPVSPVNPNKKSIYQFLDSDPEGDQSPNNPNQSQHKRTHFDIFGDIFVEDALDGCGFLVFDPLASLFFAFDLIELDDEVVDLHEVVDLVGGDEGLDESLLRDEEDEYFGFVGAFHNFDGLGFVIFFVECLEIDVTEVDEHEVEGLLLVLGEDGLQLAHTVHKLLWLESLQGREDEVGSLLHAVLLGLDLDIHQEQLLLVDGMLGFVGGGIDVRKGGGQLLFLQGLGA
jgi:hypothetical protein